MQDIRWKQRFTNFNRAFLLLREAMENDLATLSQLEKEGIIQRFEYTLLCLYATAKKSKIAQNLHKYIVINPKKNKISKNA